MGLADRQYAWEPERTNAVFGRLRFWSVNTWIIAINVAVFVIGAFWMRPGVPLLIGVDGPPGADVAREYFLPNGATASRAAVTTAGTKLMRDLVDPDTGQKVGRAFYTVQPPLEGWGHFSTATILAGQVWRFVTFQFLHANVMHLFFNMLGLYVFGPTVERYLGGQRYLAFYLVTGIFGGFLFLLLNLLGFIAYSMGISAVPGLLFHMTTTPLIGASAGVFGVIMACAKIEPDTVVQLIFPPIALKMRTFAYGFVALATINLLMGAKNAGGEAAHLGGAIAGYFFIRNSHLLRDFFDVFSDSRKPAKAGTARGGGGWGWLRGNGDSVEEVDRILAKVRTQGVASLNEKERRILARDTERLRGSGG
ncbi:MAG: rhomboid family intramembrane serine protease [Phycisphaeraceae bacterium]|nr:rhomboid family intramembrane serine protease [Phycisphaeraceae bacterium]